MHGNLALAPSQGLLFQLALIAQLGILLSTFTAPLLSLPHNWGDNVAYLHLGKGLEVASESLFRVCGFDSAVPPGSLTWVSFIAASSGDFGSTGSPTTARYRGKSTQLGRMKQVRIGWVATLRRKCATCCSFSLRLRHALLSVSKIYLLTLNVETAANL